MKTLILFASLSLGISSVRAEILLHLNASDLVLNDGDPVAAWGDLAATSPAAPTFRTIGMNGNPSVEFDGIDDTMTGATATGAVSIIVVATLDTGAPNLASLVSNNVGGLNLRRGDINANYRSEGNGGDNNDFYRHGAHSGFDNVYVNAIPSGALTYDASHVVISNAGAPTNFSGNFTLGQSSPTGAAANRWWKGDISEIYVLNRKLTVDEITGLSSVLADKWGSAAVAATPEQIYLGNLVIDIFPDTDLDGMDDVWEQAALDFDLGDAFDSLDDINPGDNLDGDNLSNLEESKFPRTNPLKGDTDDDGLLDHIESADGTFDSQLTDTGTDPNNPDTDGDSLLDGVETNDGTYDSPTDTGTNPLRADTDGDRINDDQEIALGSNPNDSDSFPPGITILGTDTGALIGRDLTDQDNIIDEVAYNPPTDSGGFDAVFSASKEPFFNGEEGSFNVFDNTVGAGTAKMCCESAPLDITAEFAQPYAITHFTLTSSNDTPGRDPLTWAISGSNDGVNFIPIYERNDVTSIWTARNQVVRIGLGAPGAAYKFIRFSVSATGNNLVALGEIEYFGVPGLVAADDIQITNIDYDQGADTFRFTWESSPGKTYTLRGCHEIT